MGLKQIIFGGAIGAALGILYAPRSGKKTRAMLADKTEALLGEEAQANGTILGEVAKTTNTAVEAGKNLFNEAASGTVGAVAKDFNNRRHEFNKVAGNKIGEFTQSNVRPVFSEKNDELRQKIEEARRKIAKQVATNLQQHKTSVEVKPVQTSGSSKTGVKKTKTSSKKKTTPKKSSPKTTAKKGTTKKTVAKKAQPKKTTNKKTSAKKATTKKTTTKKPTTKKATSKSTKKK